MKLTTNGGRIVHKPLSFAFSIIEKGGSSSQKFNAFLQEFIYDRTITPYVLVPGLYITDPDNEIPAGDYATYLCNVTWRLVSTVAGKSTTLVMGTSTYTVDTSTFACSIHYNVAVGEVVSVQFAADYLDTRRNKVSSFSWSSDLVTNEETRFNTGLYVNDTPTKVNLSVFKSRGEFSISSQLKNGSTVLDDSLCSYLWETISDDGSSWRRVTSDDLWCVSGIDTKTLRVSQSFIQKIRLRLTAYAKGDTKQHVRFFLLRRYYGQYEDDVWFSQGQFITADTEKIDVSAKVTNRQGDVTSPQRYFDMELFYRKNENSDWMSIGYGTSVSFSLLPNSGDHECALLCRELTAFLPIVLESGQYLVMDGKPVVAQFPKSKREV